jgi:hypothetical protein
MKIGRSAKKPNAPQMAIGIIAKPTAALEPKLITT